jgi:hypothetical protein
MDTRCKRAIVAGLMALGLALGGSGAAQACGDSCEPPPPPPEEKVHCNSGRGNGPEENPNSSTYIVPGTGSAGSFPTDDCDPGNSGAKNRGGD